MRFIGVEVEQETSAPPPKKNPGSAPGASVQSQECWFPRGFCYGAKLLRVDLESEASRIG